MDLPIIDQGVDWRRIVHHYSLERSSKKVKEKDELYYVLEESRFYRNLFFYELKKNKFLDYQNLKSFRFKINDKTLLSSKIDESIINSIKLELLNNTATEARYKIGNHYECISLDYIDHNLLKLISETDRLYYLNSKKELIKVTLMNFELKKQFEINFHPIQFTSKQSSTPREGYEITFEKTPFNDLIESSIKFGPYLLNPEGELYQLGQSVDLNRFVAVSERENIYVEGSDMNHFLDYFSEYGPKIGYNFYDPTLTIIEGHPETCEVGIVQEGDIVKISIFMNYQNERFPFPVGQPITYQVEHKKIFYRNFIEEELMAKELTSKINFHQWNQSVTIDEAYVVIQKCEELQIPMSYNSKKLHAPKSFEMKLSSGVDWIDLSGGVHFNQMGFMDIVQMKAILKKGDFVQFKNGEFGILPQSIRKKLSSILEISSKHEKSKDKLRLNQLHAGFINSETAKELNIVPDEAFQKKMNAFEIIQKNKVIPFFDAPKNFHGTLREYQNQGLNWLLKLHELKLNGILADDMGLGKTIQVIALLSHLASEKFVKKPLKTLIVMPKSLLHNWNNEIKKFSTNLNSVILDSEQSFQTLADDTQHTVYLVTYHYLRSNVAKVEDQKFDYLIVDEAQNIKNDQTQIFQAIIQLQADRKLILTGTPIENTILDLANLFEFLYPGSMTSGLRAKLLNSTDALNNSESHGEGGGRKSMLNLFANFVNPLILRRTKKNVLKDLPDKVEKNVFLDFQESEMSKYQLLKKAIQFSVSGSRDDHELGNSVNYLALIEGITRLRQASLDIRLLPNQSQEHPPSTKIIQLIDELKIIIENGSKAIVFSQFASFLDLIAQELKHENIEFSHIDGGTTHRERQVEHFKSSECHVLLSTLKTGGVGLNLTEAEYVFILDPWWNPAVESQAVDRAHRIGQKNTVFVTRYIMKNSIEEKVLELQNKKRSISNDVLELGEEGFFRKLTSREVTSLFQ